MKKFLFVILLALVCAPVVFAEQDKELVPLKNTSSTSSGQLVDLESRRVTSKIDDLERRLRDLENDQRSQDDRIRSVERSVGDLRRS